MAEEWTGVHIELRPVIMPGEDRRSPFRRFGEVWYHVWGRVLLALGLSGAAFAAGYLLNTTALDHVGEAFLVSAIVVFGFEWGSELKKNQQLSANLATTVADFNKYVAELRNVSAHEAVGRGMRELAGDDSMTRQFTAFADAFRRLGGGDWAAPAYMAFIRHYHEELTNRAGTLADMSEKLRKQPAYMGTEFRVSMPNPAALADVLIDATMQELVKVGGVYSAVSDVATLTKLPLFHEAQHKALPRIDVRRILVLGRNPNPGVSTSTIAAAVFEHYDDVLRSDGHYQIRITSNDRYEAVKSSLLEGVHFGFFDPVDGAGAAIAFLVLDHHLSDFRITPASPEMLASYDQLWGRFDAVSADARGIAVLRDHLLAFRVSRMEPGASCRGVSMLSNWTNGTLDRFFEASAKAAADQTITVRRILVSDYPPDKVPARLPAVIARHESAAGPHFEFRVASPEALGGDVEPFELFGNRCDDPEAEIRGDVAAGERPRFDSKHWDQYSARFDALWNKLDPVVASKETPPIPPDRGTLLRPEDGESVADTPVR